VALAPRHRASGDACRRRARSIVIDESREPFTSNTLLHFGAEAGLGVAYVRMGDWTGTVERHDVGFGSRV
jgi:hypothetical protein